MSPPKPATSDKQHRSPQFTTRAQADFRRGGAKRLAWATVLAFIGLGVLILLGPDEEEIKERFEYYGVPEELQIMPEISIIDGQDAVEQERKMPNLPPPAAAIEIIRDNPVETGTVKVPKEVMKEDRQAVATERSSFSSRAGTASRQAPSTAAPCS